MKTKIKALSDADLLQACRTHADAGTTYLDSNLAAERREVTEYYLGRRPLPIREGGSKFVSQDVYLSVEAMKAEIVETFGAGSNIVSFAPQGDDDAELAKQATALCSNAVHSQNLGLCIFQDVTHDGLTARVGMAKVSWDKRETSETFTFKNLTKEKASALIQQPKVRLTVRPTVTEGPDGQPLLSGEFEEVTDASQVCIEALPPEEFLMVGRSRSLDKSPYLAHRYRVCLGDLVDDGYDPDVVYNIGSGDDSLIFDAERQVREQDIHSFWENDDNATDQAGRMVTVYEGYIRLDVEGTGSRQLWKVVHVGDTMLSKEKVSDHPFLAFVPQPLPHQFLGNNFAARTIQHANVKTTLTRAIIEQAVDATNPRWQVARGGVTNPRELLDNRRGGIVNVRSVTDSVAPLPTASLNPFVLQTISAIDSDREDTTGISRLSQGLDKKALSNQNSSGLVEQMTSNSQTRTKLVARQFALQFVSALYLKVYKLIIENESQERIIEIAGSFTPCSPSQWQGRREVRVDMTLGFGERDERVAELLTLNNILSGPGFERMYGEPQRYELIREALDIKGHKNIARYISDPSKLPAPEPDEMRAAELEKLKVETDVAGRQMALREQQVAADTERKARDHLLKVQAHDDEISLKRADQERKDAETNNRIDIGLAELDLAIEASINADPGNVKLTAIASPNA